MSGSSKPDASIAPARNSNAAGAAASARGSRPKCESAHPDDQTALFDELLMLELELRSDATESPTPAEYIARFPDAAGKRYVCHSRTTAKAHAAKPSGSTESAATE